MTVITDTWRQLVRRRLWPVALLLVAAVVVVPMKLAKSPAPAAPVAVPHSASTGAGIATAYVATATDTARRRVLGPEKDPFAPAELSAAQLRKVKAKAKSAAKVDSTASKPSSGSKSSASGSGSGSVTSPPTVAPVATPTPTPAPTYPLYSIKANFGKTDGTMKTQTLERNRALPSAASPVIVYLGVKDDGKTAVFLLTGNVTPQGDGRCLPSATDCQTLELRAGDTEFLDVTGTGADTDAQYELDLTTIHTKSTTDAKAAAKASAAGTKLLAKTTRRKPLRYSFDVTAGTVKKLAAKDYAELVRVARHKTL